MKIGELKNSLDDLAKQLEPLDPPSKEKKKAISKKLEARMEKFQEEMGEKLPGETIAKAMNALDAEAQMTLNKAMQDFEQHLDTHDELFTKHFEVEDK